MRNKLSFKTIKFWYKISNDFTVSLCHNNEKASGKKAVLEMP